MNKADVYYKDNLWKIMGEATLDENPRPKYKDGTPAHSWFLTQVFETYDISKDEFPIPTLRNTAVKTGIREILWIYQKASNSLEVAREMGINWWEDWNIGDDTIGDRYGETVRKFDLMNNLLNGLKNDPFGRRHIITLYQYSSLLNGPGLHPCAYETLFSVRRVDGKLYLDMTLVQRSNDYIMAGYINKIQYVALMMMVAGHCGYEVGTFAHLTQNLHVYDRHMAALNEILSRKSTGLEPKLILKEKKNFFEYTIDDFEVTGLEGIEKLTSELELAV